MEAIELIQHYYEPGSKAYQLLVHHSRIVTGLALAIARRLASLRPDLRFIEEAAMLHDIGILLTNSPQLGCHGSKPYLAHGYLGSQLLQREGLSRHALVCERHVGAGIGLDEIVENNLPLPRRDMLPVTLEEEIICYADKFHSKLQAGSTRLRTSEQVRASIASYGEESLGRFNRLAKLFGEINQT